METEDRLVGEAIVAETDAGTRLDWFAFTRFPEQLCSRSRSRKAANKGLIRVNGEEKESSHLVCTGERITVFQALASPHKVFPVAIDVVFEDEQMAVVAKPSGILTNGNRFRTLENALTHNLAPSDALDALPWPRPVHRLDRATQGLVVIAKTQSGEVNLNRQFQERRVEKTYRALVAGRLDGEGVLRSPIDGRSAETRWTSVEVTRSLRTGWMTTMLLFPRTGRTHQLRRHMALLGHPISGDVLYGVPGKIFRGKGLFLAAEAIALAHPESGETMAFRLPEPGKFASHRERQRRRWQKFYGEISHWNAMSIEDLRNSRQGCRQI